MIKDVLKKYGLSQIDLADRLGINRVSVSRLLSDNNDMRISTLCKMADAIGCSPAEFFTDKPTANDDAAHIVCPHCGKPIKIHID
jgi:transcriptional regulator with XRE-family HTH domain